MQPGQTKYNHGENAQETPSVLKATPGAPLERMGISNKQKSPQCLVGETFRESGAAPKPETRRSRREIPPERLVREPRRRPGTHSPDVTTQGRNHENALSAKPTSGARGMGAGVCGMGAGALHPRSPSPRRRNQGEKPP